MGLVHVWVTSLCILSQLERWGKCTSEGLSRMNIQIVFCLWAWVCVDVGGVWVWICFDVYNVKG